jgi:cobalt-zinc-cadmium efflux system outer membrane protein
MSYSHYVEDRARIGVFRVGKFIIAPAIGVGRLNLAVHCVRSAFKASVCVFVLTLAAVHGEEPTSKDSKDERLTLPEAIAEARTQNPQMLVLEAAVASARGAVVTAKTFANPELTVEPGARRALEDTSFAIGFNGVIAISQPFKFLGKRTLEIAIAQSDVKLRDIAIEAFRFQLAAKVSRVFYQMLAAQKITEARSEQVTFAKVFVESAKKRAESGYAGDFETIKSEADLIAANAALREAEGRVTTARIALNTLLGRPPSAPLAVSGSLENLAPRGEPRDFIGLAMARNPSLQALSIEAEKTGLNLRLTRMGNLPDFSVGPSVEYFKDEQIFSLSASVTLPVWDRKKGEIQTATAEQKRALAEIAQQRFEIAGEVTKAASSLAVARDQLALYQPGFFDKLRAFVRQAEEGYAQSATTLIIYLEAKRTYFEALTGYYEALGRVAESRADLESAVGVPLEIKK